MSRSCKVVDKGTIRLPNGSHPKGVTMFLVEYDFKAYTVTMLVEKKSHIARAKREIKASILGQWEWVEIYDDSYRVSELEFNELEWL